MHVAKKEIISFKSRCHTNSISVISVLSIDVLPPRYDLVNFKDSIPEKIKQIGVSYLVNIPALRTATPLVLFKNSWLWIILGLVLIVLVLFTLRLTKEVGKH